MVYLGWRLESLRNIAHKLLLQTIVNYGFSSIEIHAQYPTKFQGNAFETTLCKTYRSWLQHQTWRGEIMEHGTHDRKNLRLGKSIE